MWSVNWQDVSNTWYWEIYPWAEVGERESVREREREREREGGGGAKNWLRVPWFPGGCLYIPGLFPSCHLDSKWFWSRINHSVWSVPCGCYVVMVGENGWMCRKFRTTPLTCLPAYRVYIWLFVHKESCLEQLNVQSQLHTPGCTHLSVSQIYKAHVGKVSKIQ